MAERTPTPWFHTRNSLNERDTHAHVSSTADEAGDTATCWLDDAKANAAFIVKAVNSHDVLMKALKHAQEALFWHDGMAFEVDGNTVGQILDAALASIKEPV